MSKTRARYVALALGTMALGLFVYKGGVIAAPTTRDVLADALWAAMIVWWLCAAAPAVSRGWRAAIALAFCFVVELGQLVHFPALDALRATTAGHLVLGSGFELRDFASYAGGVIAAAAVERVLFRAPQA